MSKFVADNITTMTGRDGELIIQMTVKGYAKRIALLACEEMMGKQICIDMKEQKNKRSLEQNAMLWALITKISDAYSGRHTENCIDDIYCMLLQKANAKSTFIMALPEAEQCMRETFRAIVKVETRMYNGVLMGVYKCFYGSSKMDTKEMSELIDYALDMCDQLGIKDSEIEYIREERR